MYRVDYHVHSRKSFDAAGAASIESIYRSASEKGLDDIALCDHYDVNWIVKGENPEIDFSDSQKQMEAARERYSGAAKKLRFLLGIELGQPNQCPEKAAEVLGKYDFDFVLCSLHNARNEQDFYYMDYKNTNILNLMAIFEKYLEELCELANWGSYHSLAHITYPLRYFFRNNIHIKTEKYTDLYIKLFGLIIGRGIALEVNASGLRKPINKPCPPFDLLKLYREMGGELVTVGSDAHNVSDIYSGIPYICEKLRSLGFKYICKMENGKLSPESLDKYES
ncbi:MAG: histidinol-phosphatase HisJ family protein [Oscillospiraceae bacterium]|nr:histidinol-phosphatase HisJ family protein [Oscillospiraceae bacterium]